MRIEVGPAWVEMIGCDARIDTEGRVVGRAVSPFPQKGSDDKWNAFVGMNAKLDICTNSLFREAALSREEEEEEESAFEVEQVDAGGEPSWRLHAGFPLSIMSRFRERRPSRSSLRKAVDDAPIASTLDQQMAKASTFVCRSDFSLLRLIVVTFCKWASRLA